jgi:predicted TIM-barrel enzyme
VSILEDCIEGRHAASVVLSPKGRGKHFSSKTVKKAQQIEQAVV